MPAGIEFAISGDTDMTRALPQFSQMFNLKSHLALGSHNSDIVLHRVLEIALQFVGVFPAAVAGLKWSQCFTGDALDFIVINRAVLISSREFGRKLTGPFSDNE